jgi:hypothetical protein
MALSPALEDREYAKFVDDGLGNTAVRVLGTFSPGAPNTRQAILDANDLVRTYTWANFGTKNERVTRIDYTAPTTVPGFTARRDFSYTFTAGAYRLDTETWSIV